jgi:hypothetical protein
LICDCRVSRWSYEDRDFVKSARQKLLAGFAPLALGAMLAAGPCGPAAASLGGDVLSVQSDMQRLKGALRVTPSSGGYTVHEIRTPANTVVREFVNTAGKVFAVAWSGPFLPDLRQTLGTSFERYQAAASAPHVGHRHLNIAQPDLVVHSAGHMRAFSGFAYLPALVPPGFSFEETK